MAADIVFLSLVESTLLDGNVVSISVLQETHVNIRLANNVASASCARKKVKKLIECEIPNVEFHKAKSVNEADRVSIKSARDSVMQVIEDEQSQGDENMKALYNAALILKKAISYAKKWTFEGSFTDTTEHIPKELYSFYRWVVHGTNTMLSSDRKCAKIIKSAEILAQSTITM